jgi:hypothetical protein
MELDNAYSVESLSVENGKAHFWIQVVATVKVLVKVYIPGRHSLVRLS